MEVTVTEDFGRCPRCRQFLIAEEKKAHKCNFEDMLVRGCEELVLDHITDLGQDRNGDHVHLAWALDGILYRLVVCKHNPPHAAESRQVTGKNRSPEGNSTRARNFYIGFFTCRNKSDCFTCLTNNQYQL